LVTKEDLDHHMEELKHHRELGINVVRIEGKKALEK